MNEQTDGIAVYDGNTLAGPLSEVFAVELTTAVGRCRSCGTSSQVATFRVYGPEPGLVGRCPHCEDVLMRLARTPMRSGSTSAGFQPCASRCHRTPPAVDFSGLRRSTHSQTLVNTRRPAVVAQRGDQVTQDHRRDHSCCVVRRRWLGRYSELRTPAVAGLAGLTPVHSTGLLWQNLT